MRKLLILLFLFSGLGFSASSDLILKSRNTGGKVKLVARTNGSPSTVIVDTTMYTVTENGCCFLRFDAPGVRVADDFVSDGSSVANVELDLYNSNSATGTLKVSIYDSTGVSELGFTVLDVSLLPVAFGTPTLVEFSSPVATSNGLTYLVVVTDISVVLGHVLVGLQTDIQTVSTNVQAWNGGYYNTGIEGMWFRVLSGIPSQEKTLVSVDAEAMTVTIDELATLVAEKLRGANGPVELTNGAEIPDTKKLTTDTIDEVFGSNNGVTVDSVLLKDGKIGTSTVTSSSIDDDSIVNADIKSDAGILATKLQAANGATNGGVLSTGAQDIGGVKKFLNGINFGNEDLAMYKSVAWNSPAFNYVTGTCNTAVPSNGRYVVIGNVVFGWLSISTQNNTSGSICEIDMSVPGAISWFSSISISGSVRRTASGSNFGAIVPGSTSGYLRMQIVPTTSGAIIYNVGFSYLR